MRSDTWHYCDIHITGAPTSTPVTVLAYQARAEEIRRHKTVMILAIDELSISIVRKDF